MAYTTDNRYGQNRGNTEHKSGGYNAYRSGSGPSRNGQRHGGYNAYKPGSGPNRSGQGSGGYNASKPGSGSSRNGQRHGGYYGAPGPIPFAPYNFVSLWDQVVLDDRPMTSRGGTDKALLSGEIDYRLTAETPIIVSAGRKGQDCYFYKNAKGEYAIPGSSVRGLLRSNAAILSQSSLANDVEDQTFMFRNVANGLDQRRYNAILGGRQVPMGKDKDGNPVSITVLANVEAGYIMKRGSGYVIQACRKVSFGEAFGKMNYYAVSERTTVADYLRSKERSGFAYLYPRDWKNVRMQYLPIAFQKQFDRNGKEIYVGRENKSFIPHYESISYETDHGRKVTAIGAPAEKGRNGTFPHNGTLLISGGMKNKKVFYIIPERDPNGKVIEIPQEDVETFRTDYNRRQNTLTFNRNSPLREDTRAKEKLQAFFNLPVEGEVKPVFYVALGGRIYFGFTPRLRTYYDHSVAGTLLDTHKTGSQDYVTDIFGCADNGELGSWKSKVSFADAVVVKDDSINHDPDAPGNKRILVLAEPRASDYLNYLQPDENGRPVNYNRDDFKIRGVKEYWLHTEANPGLTKASDITTTIYPLDKGSVFCGKIRFQNMYEDELGLLLWSLCLEKDSIQNIGMAKPYGYGAIRVGDVRLKLWNPALAYSLSFDPGLSEKEMAAAFLQPFEEKKPEQQEAQIREYIAVYQKAINRKLHGADITKLQSVRDLIMMKDGTKRPDPARTGYMELKNADKNDPKCDFATAMRNPQKVLPKPADVVGGKRSL